ncbi:MAG: hydrogenase maturation protease [Candidatus Fermentibacteraceae bacterium]
MGNALRGDDGFGPALAGRLAGRTRAVCIDAGTTPENQTAPVLRARPDAVIVADAADFGGEPGDLSLIEAGRISECGGAITHSMSLKLLADYLTGETGARIALLAVQPADTRFGRPLCERVSQALDAAESAILEALEG